MRLREISLFLIAISGLQSGAIPFSLKSYPLSERPLLSMVGKSSGDSLAVYSFKGTIPKGSKFSNPFKVYIQSNLHGNEGLTRTVTQFMMNRLLTNTGPLFGLSQQGVSFDFLPVANPTGARLVTRHNSANFDLNRNFSQFWMPTSIAPGPAPFSERETQLIRTLFQENNYNVAIDVHGYVNWVVTPSFKSKHPLSAANQRLALWKSQLTSILPLLKRETKLMSALDLGDGGAFEDWAYWEQKAFSYCLEIDHPLETGMSSTAWTEQMKNYEMYIAESIAIAARETGFTHAP